MDPITELIVNGVLAAVFAGLKAAGKSEEEAKALLYAKVDQIEKLNPLPMDLPIVERMRL